MNANDIRIFVCKIAKKSSQGCLSCVKKYPIHSCLTLLLLVLYVFFPLVFIFFISSAFLVGFAVLVHRVFISIDRPNDTSVNANGRKRWKQLQSRRSFRSGNRFRFQHKNNDSPVSFMGDPPSVRQNAKDVVFSKIFNYELVNKTTWVMKKPKETRGKGEKQENSGLHEEGSDHNERRNKTDQSEDDDDDEKSLMDLGISEIDRTKRLESLIARRRSRKLLSLPVRRTGPGQIASLHIPKPSPLRVNTSDDPGSPVPGSAPSYLLPRSPFDIPYDPYEEKPDLTEDSFMEEFMGTHPKEPKISRHVSFSLGPEPRLDKPKSSGGFVPKGIFGNSTLEKEDNEKQPKPEPDNPVSNDDVDDIQENPICDDDVDNTHEQDGPISKADVDSGPVSDADVDTPEPTTDESTSSSSSSEDEPILRPNREAILHCLSMSRLRVASGSGSGSGEHNFHRHHGSFDSDSALLDRAFEDDRFFYEENKRVVHHTATSSIASDLQVEVSELSSPPFTNLSSEIDGSEDFERPDSRPEAEIEGLSSSQSVPELVEEEAPVKSSSPESGLPPEVLNDRRRGIEFSDELVPDSLHQPEVTALTNVLND